MSRPEHGWCKGRNHRSRLLELRGIELPFGLARPFQRVLKWLTKQDHEEEEEAEDLGSDLLTTLPPSLPSLVQATSFNPKWITFLYRHFKQRSANGRMTREEWRHLMASLFHGSGNFLFADRAFAFISSQHNQASAITFKDLLLFAHGLCTSEEKVTDFIFALLQPDTLGRVSLSSFTAYVRAVVALRESTFSTSSVDERSITALASLRFRELDVDSDGFIVRADIARLVAEEQPRSALCSSAALLSSHSPSPRSLLYSSAALLSSHPISSRTRLPV